MSWITTEFGKLKKWWVGTSLGTAIDSDAKKAISELESLTEAQAEAVGVAVGTAALGGLATGGAAGAFAAGVAAAGPALEKAEAVISTTTINTLVASAVNQLQTQAAIASTTPASAS